MNCTFVHLIFFKKTFASSKCQIIFELPFGFSFFSLYICRNNRHFCFVTTLNDRPQHFFFSKNKNKNNRFCHCLSLLSRAVVPSGGGRGGGRRRRCGSSSVSGCCRGRSRGRRRLRRRLRRLVPSPSPRRRRGGGRGEGGEALGVGALLPVGGGVLAQGHPAKENVFIYQTRIQFICI